MVACMRAAAPDVFSCASAAIRLKVLSCLCVTFSTVKATLAFRRHQKCEGKKTSKCIAI